MSGYDGRGGKYDIIAVRGADLAFTVTATSGGSPLDLSAATIAGELYDAAGAVVDTMTDVVSGAGSNIITLSFTDTETTALTGESYPWTLWVTRGGDKRPWLAGRVRVVDSSNGVTATNGDAITLTVDSDINVSIDVLAVGGSGGGASTLDELTDVTITTPVNGNVLTYADGDWVNDTPAGGGDLLAANNLSDVASATTARTNLGLAIGTNVQAYSSVLAATTASFTTADETKLDGIATGATDDTTVNNHIADTSDAHDASAISVLDTATQYTATDVEAALAEVKVIADAAVTPAEAAAAYQPLDSDLTTIAAGNNGTVLAATTASFTTADETKLDGIEAAADVTDATNVTAAGALMDSEVASLSGIKTLTVPDSTTISTFGATLVDDTSAQAALATLRVAPATVTGTTDTLAAGDDATVILYTAAGAVTVTLANIATGFECVLVCLGAGGLSVAAGGMSFANSFTPKLTVAQGEALYVKQTAASTFIVLGGTAT